MDVKGLARSSSSVVGGQVSTMGMPCTLHAVTPRH
jgi:hypothetical protein